jgi:hypothetical protein
MKMNLLTSALVAILGLALAGVPVTAQAQTPTTAAPAAAPADTSTAPKVKEKKAKADKTGKIQYSGSVTAISATSLTVATTKEALTLAIDATTEFKTIGADKKKTAAAVTDFAVGDKVTGSYKKNADGTLTAASVHKKIAAAK